MRSHGREEEGCDVMALQTASDSTAAGPPGMPMPALQSLAKTAEKDSSMTLPFPHRPVEIGPSGEGPTVVTSPDRRGGEESVAGPPR